MSNHPYKEYEHTECWEVISQAIAALVENGDLVEKTTHEHIVGYLCKMLESNKNEDN